MMHCRRGQASSTSGVIGTMVVIAIVASWSADMRAGVEGGVES